MELSIVVIDAVTQQIIANQEWLLKSPGSRYLCSNLLHYFFIIVFPV